MNQELSQKTVSSLECYNNALSISGLATAKNEKVDSAHVLLQHLKSRNSWFISF